jgi:hypothetical protein
MGVPSPDLSWDTLLSKEFLNFPRVLKGCWDNTIKLGNDMVSLDAVYNLSYWHHH